ncbi:hypothetical protein ACRALDRAFT_1056496 [Sodiomyces alcalophilus JCM 7366]|uniref:uncharacterized protein n=1 Tax=Sodiomyces alcalophilus JCM 7366 TaxID=591952 RepID=UPI0039B666D3
MTPSSPRLPSPPPPAEDQIGPPSPAMGTEAGRQASQLEQALLDANSKRRIHPGTKAHDMAAGPPLVSLNELDSAFQLQEHLAALHFYHTKSNTQAITRATAIQLATPPSSIDRTLWLYELCRFLIAQCNSLIVGFLFDAPPCSAHTCPEMRASEWQFLCAVHEQPKSCCAIDYCCHTLDWAANVVTDPKIFPSRFVVSSDAHNKSVAVKNLVNVFRRLHRIFAHAWFQHRAVFWNIENQSGLYVFFKTVCDMYDLLPAENYKLPPEAEGLDTAASAHEGGARDASEAKKPIQPLSIAKPLHRQQQQHQQQQQQQQPLAAVGGIGDDGHQSLGRNNTRRHIRASPSTGSAVTTVMETEEEDHDVTSKLQNLHISTPAAAQEEYEVAEVPVIVEQEVVADASSRDPSPADDNELSRNGEEKEAQQTSSEGESPAKNDDNSSTQQVGKDETSETPATDAPVPEPESKPEPEPEPSTGPSPREEGDDIGNDAIVQEDEGPEGTNDAGVSKEDCAPPVNTSDGSEETAGAKDAVTPGEEAGGSDEPPPAETNDKEKDDEENQEKDNEKES